MTEPRQPAQDAMAGEAIHQKWVSAYRTADAQAFYERAFDRIVGLLSPQPDAVILDAGCGSCAKSVLLAARGFKVVGTDYSPRALELAAQTLRARGLDDRITLRQGDLLSLPFPDGEFRYALCWGVLMHVPEVARALRELARVLAPGGTLVVSEGNMHSLQSVAIRALKRVLGRDRGNVVRTAAGLEATEATADGTLLTRQTDIGWLVAEADRLGLSLRHRLAGQFTELYVLAPGMPVKRLIHRVNDLWFRHIRRPGPAFGNILVFEKRS